MDIKNLLFALWLAVALNCTLSSSLRVENETCDFSTALKSKERLVKNLDYFEENNDGETFMVIADDANDVRFRKKQTTQNALSGEGSILTV